MNENLYIHIEPNIDYANYETEYTNINYIKITRNRDFDYPELTMRAILILKKLLENFKCNSIVYQNDGYIESITIENTGEKFNYIDIKYKNFDNLCPSSKLLKGDYYTLFNNSFFNLLKNRNLINFINYIELFSYDYIINVSAREMLHYISKKLRNNSYLFRRKDIPIDLREEPKIPFVKTTIYDLLGCYIHTNRYSHYDLIDDYINQINCHDNKKIILLCNENIENMYGDLAYTNDDVSSKLQSHLAKMVLFHEFGHLVFDFNCYKERNRTSEKFHEQQANYYLSQLFCGEYDKLIKKMTSLQSSNYKDPILYSEECEKFLYIFDTKVYKLYMDEE